MIGSRDGANWVEREYTDSIGDNDEVVVQAEDACPKCGERRCDYLVWDDDGTFVTCTTCKAVYCPIAPMVQEA